MLDKEKFNKLYSEVAEGLNDTLAQLQGLRVEHEESKQHVVGMIDRLESIQKSFSDEIAMLEDNAEWDKFTIAFFGETNAGKSTIIESLRIMFDEETRRNTIAHNQKQLDQFEKDVVEQTKVLKRTFADAYGALARDLLSLRQDVVAFKEYMDAEKSKRLTAEADNQALHKKCKQLRAACITSSILAVVALGAVAWMAGGA